MSVVWEGKREGGSAVHFRGSQQETHFGMAFKVCATAEELTDGLDAQSFMDHGHRVRKPVSVPVHGKSLATQLLKRENRGSSVFHCPTWYQLSALLDKRQ